MKQYKSDVFRKVVSFSSLSPPPGTERVNTMPRNIGDVMIEYKPPKTRKAEAFAAAIFSALDGVYLIVRGGVFWVLYVLLKVTVDEELAYVEE